MSPSAISSGLNTFARSGLTSLCGVWAKAALVALCLHAAPVGAQIADPGFDIQGASTADFCYFGGGCASGPWIGSGAGIIHANSVTWAAGAAVSPSHMLFIQGTGSAGQGFTVPNTGTYRLSWWDAGRSGAASWGGNQSYQVKINTTLIASANTTSGQPFRRRSSASIVLTAGTTYTLYILGQVITDDTAFIDSIVLSPATETQSYSYDALGRLTGTAYAGPLNGGLAVNGSYDAAGNRATFTVSGSPN